MKNLMFILIMRIVICTVAATLGSFLLVIAVTERGSYPFIVGVVMFIVGILRFAFYMARVMMIPKGVSIFVVSKRTTGISYRLASKRFAGKDLSDLVFTHAEVQSLMFKNGNARLPCKNKPIYFLVDDGDLGLSLLEAKYSDEGSPSYALSSLNINDRKDISYYIFVKTG